MLRHDFPLFEKQSKDKEFTDAERAAWRDGLKRERRQNIFKDNLPLPDEPRPDLR